jgi:hypothetical protein
MTALPACDGFLRFTQDRRIVSHAKDRWHMVVLNDIHSVPELNDDELRTFRRTECAIGILRVARPRMPTGRSNFP